MADYTIYVLQEDDLVVSGPDGKLDGVTQGTGEHLLGRTITIGSNNWQPVAITDDDADFRDNDSSQRLDGQQELNGQMYSSNAVVEAEYGLEVTDGTNTWTLLGFNVRDSQPSYATIEGLAVLDSPQGFPQAGAQLTVTNFFEGPSFEASNYEQPICFANGTLIDTAHGPMPVEKILPGMQMTTRDHGTCDVLWGGHRSTIGTGACAPVRIAAGTFGNDSAVFLSQEHRVLVSDWRAPYYFGVDEILVPAKSLTCLAGVDLVTCGPINYHHLLLETHAVVSAHGLWSESLWLGPQAMKSLAPAAQQELQSRFAHLIGGKTDYLLAKGFEAQVLQRAA